MADILDVPFGGLQGLVNPNRIPFEAAITASDCFLDDDTVTGRSGYRSLCATQIVSAGNPQFLGRFQPDITLAATNIVVIDGSIYLVTDTSSETVSDGVITLLSASVFGTTDNISGAQLGTNYYLTTDNATPKWVRITSALALETIQQLPTPVIPSFSLSSLSFIPFPSPPTTGWTFAGGVSASVTGISTWSNIVGPPGGTATIAITPINLQNTAWLLVVCSPNDVGNGGGSFTISLGNSGTFTGAQTVYDTPGNDSPFAVYIFLAGLDPTILLNVNQVRFTQVTTSNTFDVLGYMAINTAPEPGTVPYYVTYFNSVTGAESTLSPVTNVVYNSKNTVFPQYQAARWSASSFVNAGIRSTNPDSLTPADNFNAGAGLQSPTANDFISVYTFFRPVDPLAFPPFADTVRLYRGTPNGISLVGSSVYSTDGTAPNARRADGSVWTTGTGTNSDLPTNVSYWQPAGFSFTWSITDGTGSSASANALYQAGGPGPRTTTLCSIDDRLVAAYGNRVYISSFTPVTAASNLIPEWPPIAIQDSDGWSFNIDPSPTEQILSVIAGDALYICTNSRVEILRDLTPGTVPFEVFNRGIIGRNAGIYSEEQLIWASFDGVYSAQNVTNTSELTQPIRIYIYEDEFVPDSTVTVGYQLRKLRVFKGNIGLRYDFVTSKWTGPDTFANAFFSCLSYVGLPDTLKDQMWVLTNDLWVSRFQPFCANDNQIGSSGGTKPPAWIYGTGFSRTAKPGFCKEISVLSSGVITAKVAKTLDAIEPDEGRMLVANSNIWRTEVDFSGPTDFRGKKLRLEFSGKNNVTLYTAHMIREEIDARGG